MDAINWKVEGMTCANCALTIGKYLEKQGMQQVKVNLVSGEVMFETVEVDSQKEEELKKGIKGLGYIVAGNVELGGKEENHKMNRYLKYVLICAPFTLVLMLHMIPAIHKNLHWLVSPWLQLVLSLPVYFIGMNYFGRSAYISIRNKMPNMNVLVATGATAAFVYSVIGTLMGKGEQYQYYETAATIITLVFLGNYLEDSSIETTQRALQKLAKSQKVMANMIAFDDKHEEIIFPVENTQLRSGDLILIKSGDQVPADCKILWGSATVNESIITGESLPLTKQKKDLLIGGSILTDGTVKAQVNKAAGDSVLSNIINLVKQAQGEKPPVQQMADKISAIFVPVVLGITLLTFVLNYWFLSNFTESLMRSVAVLVISCPCAMGLATPAAIAVGLGRSARSGILFRNSKSLELFRNIRQVVFDKTGTLTTGKFTISKIGKHDEQITEDELMRISYSLEKFSNHPIAQCIAASFNRKDAIRWKKIEEVKGLGMEAEDQDGIIYKAGSFKIAEGLTTDATHNIYIIRNNKLLGWIDVKDEIRPEAKSVLEYLHKKNLHTVLLSGDRKEKCEVIAKELGIDEVIAEQTPEQKLDKIAALNSVTPTAMVGDGINDAPALARATIGISLSEASQVAIQTADVVLMSSGLQNLPKALGLGKHTYMTIQQNLFWAFFYNIIAIPAAAFGMLGTYGPTYGALIMGLSDVVLAVNSVRLFIKKVV